MKSSAVLSAVPNCSMLLEEKRNVNICIYLSPLEYRDEWKTEELEVIFRISSVQFIAYVKIQLEKADSKKQRNTLAFEEV